MKFFVSIGRIGIIALGLFAGADDVEVIRSFPGNQGPGWKTSIDAAGAVGPHHVVAFDVAGFVARDKASGREAARFTAAEFWRHVHPQNSLTPETNANDSRIIYDSITERWFACAAGTTVPDCFLAVSEGSDPTGAWFGTRLPLPRINPYMKLGVDKNGLYVCSCNGHPDVRKAANCYVIPIRDAVASGGPTLDRAQTFTGLPLSIMPALDPDPNKPADAPAILLANQFSEGQCGELSLYRIHWQDGKAVLSDLQTIPLSTTYLTPDNTSKLMEARQPAPGPRFRAGGGGRRLDSVFVRNGRAYGCNGALRSRDSRPGVLWYEVRISDGAVLQEGLVDDAKRDYIFPSVAVDRHGNIGIGCTGTSEHEFPSVYVMMRSAADPPNTMRAPVIAAAGTGCYRYSGKRAINLSHYSTTCVDPTETTRLWTYQAYGGSAADQVWSTAWGAFRLGKGGADTPHPAKVGRSADSVKED